MGTIILATMLAVPTIWEGRDVDTPPNLDTPGDFMDVLQLYPIESILDEHEGVDPSTVELRYRNDSGNAKLELILINLSKFYKREAGGYLLQFPFRSEENIYDKFEKGNGWYLLWVDDGTDEHFLGCVNLFATARPWLIVDADGHGKYRMILRGATEYPE